ncbi:MAG: transporter substrate-binding domain-containing protein [Dehalococcoidia bacterium]|nr:MAG: transporter substrate-binding domain-containing protein [Dehalococcoidia bacterium]
MTTNFESVPLSAEAQAQLTTSGALRAGINMGNFLLVTGRTPEGDPDGVSPDLARAIAARLGVPLKLVPYKSPGELGDAVNDDAWDIGLIGAEPQRAEKIAFTDAYAEIEATYLVPAGSPIRSVDEVDRPGVRIAVSPRSAYGLWLERNIKEATLVRLDTADLVFDRFVADGIEAMAALRPGLLEDVKRLPGARVLDGHFSVVQQAVGTPKANTAAAAFLQAFVEHARDSGFVAGLIAKHGVDGRLAVAGQR